MSQGVRRVLKLRSGSSIQKRQCRVASLITFFLLRSACFGLHVFISSKLCAVVYARLRRYENYLSYLKRQKRNAQECAMRLSESQRADPICHGRKFSISIAQALGRPSSPVRLRYATVVSLRSPTCFAQATRLSRPTTACWGPQPPNPRS